MAVAFQQMALNKILDASAHDFTAALGLPCDFSAREANHPLPAVVPSSREAALFSRRALRQRENKVGLRTRRPVIWEPSTEQQRACEVVA